MSRLDKWWRSFLVLTYDFLWEKSQTYLRSKFALKSVAATGKTAWSHILVWKCQGPGLHKRLEWNNRLSQNSSSKGRQHQLVRCDKRENKADCSEVKNSSKSPDLFVLHSACVTLFNHLNYDNAALCFNHLPPLFIAIKSRCKSLFKVMKWNHLHIVSPDLLCI